jgi:hypothetical protein
MPGAEVVGSWPLSNVILTGTRCTTFT